MTDHDAHPDPRLDRHEHHDLPDLPSRVTDDDVARLPLELGLADLERGLLAEGAAPRRRRRRLVGSVAAASAVAAVLGGGVVVAQLDRPTDTPVPPPVATQDRTAPTTSPTTAPGPAGPALHGVAWRAPRSFVVLDAPGWTPLVEEVRTDPGYGLSYGWQRGQARFEVGYVTTEWWEDLVADNLGPGAGTRISEIDVLGRTVPYAESDSQQQHAFLPVEDGYGIRLDGTFTTPAEFADLVTGLETVGAPGFEAAMPGVIPPSGLEAALDDAAAELSVPDGLPPLPVAGYNGATALAADTFQLVSCGWVAEYAAALDGGDPADVDTVATTLTENLRTGLARRAGFGRDFFDHAVAAMLDGKPVAAVSGLSGCGSDSEDSLLEDRLPSAW